MRYIEKAAYTWTREGIYTLELAEEYLKSIEAKRDVRGQIKKELQITGREFSPTEKCYVDHWIAMGFEAGAIAHAYDITVVKTGSLAWPYMDKILRKWDAHGWYTAEQVQKNESSSKGGYNARTGGNQNEHKHGEPNREQLDRMTRLLEKIKEE